MHCYICDRTLSDTEIVYNRQIGEYEPCSTCLTAALDAAYTNGFSPDEPLDDPDLQEKHGSGAVETLESSTWASDYQVDYKHGYWEGVD